MSNDLTAPLDPIQNLTQLVEALGARLERVEVALDAGSKQTRPMSARIDRLLAELVEFKADVRQEFHDTRTLLRADIHAETKTVHDRLADLEKRVRDLEAERRAN
jgi:ABC-type transporter Mla subunit MlaD